MFNPRTRESLVWRQTRGDLSDSLGIAAAYFYTPETGYDTIASFNRGLEIVDWTDPSTPSHRFDSFPKQSQIPVYVARMKGLSVTRMTVRGKSQATLPLS